MEEKRGEKEGKKEKCEKVIGKKREAARLEKRESEWSVIRQTHLRKNAKRQQTAKKY